MLSNRNVDVRARAPLEASPFASVGFLPKRPRISNKWPEPISLSSPTYSVPIRKPICSTKTRRRRRSCCRLWPRCAQPRRYRGSPGRPRSGALFFRRWRTGCRTTRPISCDWISRPNWLGWMPPEASAVAPPLNTRTARSRSVLPGYARGRTASAS